MLFTDAVKTVDTV